MPSTSQDAKIELPWIEQLTDVGDDAPSIAEKCQLVEMIRSASPQLGTQLDRFLLEESVRLRRGLLEARVHQEKLQGVVEQLTALPWFAGTFLCPVATPHGQQALIAQGNSQRSSWPGRWAGAGFPGDRGRGLSQSGTERGAGQGAWRTGAVR